MSSEPCSLHRPPSSSRTWSNRFQYRRSFMDSPSLGALGATFRHSLISLCSISICMHISSPRCRSHHLRSLAHSFSRCLRCSIMILSMSAIFDIHVVPFQWLSYPLLMGFLVECLRCSLRILFLYDCPELSCSVVNEDPTAATKC